MVHHVISHTKIVATFI